MYLYIHVIGEMIEVTIANYINYCPSFQLSDRLYMNVYGGNGPCLGGYACKGVHIILIVSLLNLNLKILIFFSFAQINIQ